MDSPVLDLLSCVLWVHYCLAGAAFGRLMGHMLHKIDNVRGTFADRYVDSFAVM